MYLCGTFVTDHEVANEITFSVVQFMSCTTLDVLST